MHPLGKTPKINLDYNPSITYTSIYYLICVHER